MLYFHTNVHIDSDPYLGRDRYKLEWELISIGFMRFRVKYSVSVLFFFLIMA